MILLLAFPCNENLMIFLTIYKRRLQCIATVKVCHGSKILLYTKNYCYLELEKHLLTLYLLYIFSPYRVELILLKDPVKKHNGEIFANQVQNCYTLEVNVLLRINLSILTYIAKISEVIRGELIKQQELSICLFTLYGGCEIRIFFSLLCKVFAVS
jgi:hypothetical protein